MNHFLDCGCSVILDIRHPGELAAGIRCYSDVVTVTVESGNPGGEKGEFEEWMRQCMADWFDGARVTIRPNAGHQRAAESGTLNGLVRQGNNHD